MTDEQAPIHARHGGKKSALSPAFLRWLNGKMTGVRAIPMPLTETWLAKNLVVTQFENFVEKYDGRIDLSPQ